MRSMAIFGDYVNGSEYLTRTRVGKHGIALKAHCPAWQVALSAALVIMLALVPITIAFSHTKFDSQAFADSTRSSFASIEDASPQDVRASLPNEIANYPARIGAKMQNSIMCGGCEIVSLGIVLESMGIDADLDRIANDFLDINGHFATGYSGSPYSEGAGFPQGITAAANGYLESVGSTARAHDLSGLSFDELKTIVNMGYPVLAWSTMGLDDPQFTGMFDGDIEWYANEHCVVFYAINGDEALVSDPIEGLVTRDAARFADVYEQCGRHALAIY